MKKNNIFDQLITLVLKDIKNEPDNYILNHIVREIINDEYSTYKICFNHKNSRYEYKKKVRNDNFKIVEYSKTHWLNNKFQSIIDCEVYDDRKDHEIYLKEKEALK